MNVVRTIEPAIVVEAAAYATGNVAGGLLTLTGAAPLSERGTVLRSATLRSKVGTSIAWDLFFLNASPSASTITERAAVAINTADLAKIVGHITFAATDLKLAAAATMGAWVRSDLGLWMKPATGVDLYAVLVARGSITPALTTDISLTLAFDPR